MLTAALVLVFLFLVGLYFFTAKPSHFPPGPPWIPFLDNSLLVRKLAKKCGYLHEALDYLCREYDTDVLGLKMNGVPTVVVNSFDSVRHVLTNSVYDARPNSYFIRLRCLGACRGLTCANGPLWQEHRAFALTHMRRFGFGSPLTEQAINKEMEYLLKRFDDISQGKTVKIEHELARTVLSVLWAFIAGSSFPKNDPQLQNFLFTLDHRGKLFDMAGGWLNQYPWLRFVAPNWSGYNLIKDMNKKLFNFIMELINDHRKTYNRDKIRDLIDSYLYEMETREDPHTFTEIQVVMSLLDLFIAGSQTTSGTIAFLLLCMVLYPDVQKKLQQEIDTVIGHGRLPTYEDKSKMPYAQAVIAETMRLYHVTPITGPRVAIGNTKIGDYFIPKNTTVLINNWPVHMDKDHWKDPEVYRPERFIAEDGSFCTDEWLLPFGLGRRRCLGEQLAKIGVFLVFIGIMQKYTLSPHPDKPKPSPKPVPGITITVKPFSMQVKSRVPQ